MMRPIWGTVVVVLAGCGGSGSDSSTPSSTVRGYALTTETHSVASAPGVTLKLFRTAPSSGRAYPNIVFLVHGFGIDHGEYDLEPPLSFARYLAENGFEVWAMDSRGSGDSSPQSLTDANGWRFNFDDVVHVDLHAALEYSLAASGAPGYVMLGHSLGGAAPLAYVTTHPQTPCKGAILVAPTICVPYVGWQTDPRREKFWKWVSPLRFSLPTGLPLPMSKLAQGVAMVLPEPAYSWTVWTLNWFVGPLIWSPENTNKEIATMALKTAVSDVNSTMLRQLMTWGEHLDSTTYGPSPYEWHYESSSYQQANGFQSYSARLPKFTVPQLWLAAPADYFVPPAMVYAAYSLSGAADKTFVEANKASGFSVDYGHGDLMIGVHTPKETYPLMLGWLQEHAK